MNHIADVLLGSNTQKIRDLGHNKLPVYGVEKVLPKEAIRHFILALQTRKYLIKNDGEYPTLRVSESGKDFLKYREKITLPKPPTILKVGGKKLMGDLDFDQLLFRELQVLRKEIANQKNVPPFVIFSDVALREMSYYFPQSLDSFARISGVGAMKLTQYGEQFLKIIVNYAKKNSVKEIIIPLRSKDINIKEKLLKSTSKNRKSKSSSATMQFTRELISQKLSLADIEKKRGLSYGTILTHLEALIDDGDDVDISYITFPQERLGQIRSAFEKSGGYILTPALKILGEGFSYEELRLARVLINKGNQLI